MIPVRLNYVTTQMLLLKPIISGTVEHLFNIFFYPVVFLYFPGMCVPCSGVPWPVAVSGNHDEAKP